MKTINKILCLLVLAVFTAGTIKAQNSKAYDYATDKKGNLKKDANSNTIDFSTVMSVVTANSSNQNTQIYSLPFNVVFLGKVYKNFMIGTSGYLVLGNNDNTSQPFQFPVNSANTFKQGNNNYRFQGVIAPFWDFQTAQSVKYTVTGTAPNRTLVVEWVTYAPSAAAPKSGYECNYQARIYENNGVVEFVYGQMAIPTGNTTAVSATIGISANSALYDSSFIAVTDLDSFVAVRELAKYVTTTDNLYNKADTGFITPLNYDNDSTARRFTFSPIPVYAPTNLQSINITFDDAVLYWDDNSYDEVAFELYKKDRYGNFSFFDTTTHDINFYSLAGLYPGETYSFKVRAYNQGQYSAFSNTFTFSTPQAQLMEAVNSGLWSDPATWSTNATPTRYDSVVISNGYIITMDNSNANAYHLVVDSGVVLYENTTQTRKLSVYGSVWVNKNGVISVNTTPTNNNLGLGLAIRGNLYNKGVLDLYAKDAISKKEAGVKLSYFGPNISLFTSDSGSVTDLSTFAVERNQIADSVYFHPYDVTIRGFNNDIQSGAGLIETSAWVGTLAMDADIKINNRLFASVNPTVGDNARLWLANDSLEVPAQNTNLTFNGTLRVSGGKINIGNADNNIVNGSFDLIIEGGELNIGGRLYSTNATSFTQTGGKLRIATVGNNTTEPTFGILTGNIQMLGGEIILVQPGTAAGRIDYYVNGGGASVFTNTWVKLTETAGMAAGRDFVIRGVLPNLLLDTAANSPATIKIKLPAVTTVSGKLIISNNDTINLSPAFLFVNDTIVNNGFVYSSSISGALVISGKSQLLTGKGFIKTPRIEIRQVDTLSTFTIGADSLISTLAINLSTGKVINTKYLQLGDSVNVITIEVGRIGTLYNGADLDTFPRLLQGTGAINLIYQNLAKVRNTANEIPSSRLVNTLTINTDSAIIIKDGVLNVLQTLTLTKGIFATDTANKIRVINPLTAAVSGGSTLTYVKGPLTRRIDKKLLAATYNFPVGADSYSAIALTNITTDTNVVELTAAFNNSMFNYTLGKGISKLDTAFGHWILNADSNAKSLTNFGLSINYKTADGFIRLAAGKTDLITSAVPLDSVGTKVSTLSTTLTCTNLYLDSANTVLFVVAGEYLGDTLYNETFKVGRGKDFENLTAISKKLATSFIAGNPTFLITSTYEDANEVYPIFFNQMRYAGNGGKVLIRLDSNAVGIVTGSKTKTLDATYGMIAMYGADSIEFDGAGYDIVGNPTNTREWTFKTETNAAGAPVFLFQQDARYNTLSNLNVIANGTGTNGAVNYGTTYTGGRGNDYNTLDNNFFNINDRVVNYGVISLGLSAASTNDSGVVINNEFSNFAIADMELATNTGPGWKISGNHFYQNDSRVLASAAKAIDVTAATAYGIEISNNYIGGTQKYALGTPWAYGGTGVNTLVNLNSSVSFPSIFRGNVIKNYSQSNSATLTVRIVTLTAGKWVISGNKIGGSVSTADGLSFSNTNVMTMLYVSTTVSPEITDNEFAFISNFNLLSANKGFKAIEYLSAVSGYIARNVIHDIQNLSSRTTSVQDAAIVGIYLSTASSGNVIENNEIYRLINNSSTGIAYVTGIGINNGNGDIRNNKIYALNNTTTSASVSTVDGMHINLGLWNVYNNLVTLSNELYPNMPVSLQGIRMYSTTAATSKLYNNTILIGGQTKSTNSYGLVHGTASVRAEIYNNIIVNNNNMTGGITFKAIAMHVTTAASTLVSSDFNLLYAPVDTNTLYSATTGLSYTPERWKSTFGYEKNSIFKTIPKFRDTVKNLLLTLDSVNWKLNAAGRATTFTLDYEGDTRDSKQPDIGADEFAAPMYDKPVLMGGNDTLCAGNTRTLVAQNPNSNGQIYWFTQPYGGDTLAIGDTLTTATVNINTNFYAQVSDTLMRSYRITVPIRIMPVVTPKVTNLPVDSICSGTSLNLVALSAAGLTINWYDSLAAVTPFYTGNTYNTGALTDSITYYISTTNNGCTSAKVPFKVFVSDTTVGTPLIANQTICNSSNVTWTTNGPDVIRWYDAELETSWLLEDTIFDAGTINADTTFWYEAYNGRCVGNRNVVTVKVNKSPAAPVIDSLFTICYNGSISLSAIVTGTANWYADTVSTTPLTTGSLALSNLINDTTLFVENTLAGCISPRVKTMVAVQIPSVVNVVSTTSPVCYNAAAQIMLTKTGNGSIKWYDQFSANTAIANGDTFNTPLLTNDITYYYELSDGICTGARDSVVIPVIPFATKPVIIPVDSICFGEIDTLSATATGATINWYETKTSASISSGNDFVTPAITGNKKYFARANYSGCESDFEEVNVHVRALPQPPVVDSVSLVCRGTATTLKASTPAITEWYNSPFAATPVYTGNTYATGNLTVNTTYYVQAFDGVCRSEKRAVPVALRNAPADPIVKTTNPFCWADNGVIEASSNSLVRWYKNSADTVPFLADSSVYIGKMYRDTVFYIESYDGYCTSNRITYNVNVLRYLDNFSFSIPDSANISTQVAISAQGNIDNLYGWNFGAGANISSATGTGPHNIEWNTKGFKTVRLSVTKRSGSVTCDTVFTKTVKVYNLSELMNVGEIGNTSLLSVYPNPASSMLNIITKGENTIESISLYDITGKQVYNEAIERTTQKVLNVDGFAQGVYLLHISLSNNQTVIQKVIID